MAWSFSIGTIAGTAIRVHVTFALLLIWIWLMHYRIGGTPAAMEGIAFIVAVFVCVVLHEFGHIAAARRFGIKTPDITTVIITSEIITLPEISRIVVTRQQSLEVARGIDHRKFALRGGKQRVDGVVDGRRAVEGREFAWIA